LVSFIQCVNLSINGVGEVALHQLSNQLHLVTQIPGDNFRSSSEQTSYSINTSLHTRRYVTCAADKQCKTRSMAVVSTFIYFERDCTEFVLYKWVSSHAHQRLNPPFHFPSEKTRALSIQLTPIYSIENRFISLQSLKQKRHDSS